MEDNTIDLSMKINGVNYGMKVALEDLKPIRERTELKQGMAEYFKKRVKEGYMPIINPNYPEGRSIEYIAEVLSNSMVKTYNEIMLANSERGDGSTR